MGKKKSDARLSFQLLYNPYENDSDDTTSQLFQRYLNDENAVVEIDNKTYYRALQIFILNISGKSDLIALLDNRLNLKTNDEIIDDNDNIFTVKGFAMFRFTCDIPDWYMKVSFVELFGDYKNIGHFFTKI